MKILEDHLQILDHLEQYMQLEQENEDESGSHMDCAGALCEELPDFPEAKFYVRLKAVKREYEEPGQVRYRKKSTLWGRPMKNSKKYDDADPLKLFCDFAKLFEVVLRPSMEMSFEAWWDLSEDKHTDAEVLGVLGLDEEVLGGACREVMETQII